MRLEPSFAESEISSLEAIQAVFFTLIEAVIASCVEEADVAEPLALRNT